MGRYRFHTGPTIVQQTAEKLRQAGINVTIEGTEHVHFDVPSDDPQEVTLQLREILGPQWGRTNVEKIGSPMANEQQHVYASILDEILDGSPRKRFTESGTEKAKGRGDDLSSLTQDLAEDGIFTSHVATHSDASREHIAKKLSDDNILNDVSITENEAKSNDRGLKKSINEASVCKAIDTLLHQGHSVKAIQAALDKKAELNLWNKQLSTNYLNSRANDLGMGYIQPNSFMPKQPGTYEGKPASMKDKRGSVTVFTPGQNDALSIGESKFGGSPRKQANAVEISITANADARSNKPGINRAETPVSIRTAKDQTKTAAAHHLGEDFDGGTVGLLHKQGKTLEQIYDHAVKTAGLHAASKAFHEFVSRAKGLNTKFASADVNFLRTKLGIKGVEEAPIKTAPMPRMAYDSGKNGGPAPDGNKLLKEFDLNATRSMDTDPRMSTASNVDPLDVEVGNPEINL
jgi:hypothetical protein